jgi:hypothetical protein
VEIRRQRISGSKKMGNFRKLAICLLIGVVAAFVLQRIIYRIIWEFGNKHIPPPVCAIAGLVLVVMAAVIFRRRVHAHWQGILAGWMALDLAMFGWQKLFRLQDQVPLGRLDEPFNSLSGEDLTWAFFGRSFPFFCLVGILQITGAFLLMFRRTRLFGAIFLLPVILNIVLLNICYGFEAGDTVHAVILLVGLSCLILVHYERLRAVFFRRDGGPASLVLPVLVIVTPLLLVLSFGSPDRNPQLTGKYRVEDLSVNGVKRAATSSQDSVLSTVYFDQGNDVVFEFNSLERRWIGSYRLDRVSGALTASWRYPIPVKDPLLGRLDRVQEGEWRIMGIVGKDSLRARLVKE